MKHVKNIEKMYDLLKECRRIFVDLGEDTIVDVGDIQKVCIQIDNLIEEEE